VIGQRLFWLAMAFVFSAFAWLGFFLLMSWLVRGLLS